MSGMSIWLPALIFAGMGLLFGSLIALTGKLFHVAEDPRKEAIRALLPGANCGGCGCAGCDAYAQAVLEGKAGPAACAVAGKAAAEKIGEIIGKTVEVPEPQVATVACRGAVGVCSVRFEYNGPRTCRAAEQTAMGDKSCAYSCLGYGDCAAACKFGAIVMEEGRLARVDGEKCVQTYYGANGNASGMAMLIELARKISMNSMLFRRSVIFVGFGASCASMAGSWYSWTVTSRALGK